MKRFSLIALMALVCGFLPGLANAKSKFDRYAYADALCNLVATEACSDMAYLDALPVSQLSDVICGGDRYPQRCYEESLAWQRGTKYVRSDRQAGNTIRAHKAFVSALCGKIGKSDRADKRPCKDEFAEDYYADRITLALDICTLSYESKPQQRCFEKAAEFVRHKELERA
ncbi:MAG TPA: hypothetical protein VM432_08280, partial [Bdellovibrionales bacterium]|nr:hypothetical protein [Bdellovibrionales bacterium]